MTKISVLGYNEVTKELQKIEFIEFFDGKVFSLIGQSQEPKEWEYITLLFRDYTRNLDLMFAHPGDSGQRLLVLGKFNDGVV